MEEKKLTKLWRGVQDVFFMGPIKCRFQGRFQEKSIKREEVIWGFSGELPRKEHNSKALLENRFSLCL